MPKNAIIAITMLKKEMSYVILMIIMTILMTVILFVIIMNLIEAIFFNPINFHVDYLDSYFQTYQPLQSIHLYSICTWRLYSRFSVLKKPHVSMIVFVQFNA